MSWDRLVRISGPAEAPLSVGAAMAHLRIDDLTPEATTDLAQLIEAAVGEIDGPNGCGIAMVTQTWQLTLDRFPPVIRLLMNPVSAITSVKYIATDGVETTLAADQYLLAKAQDPALLVPAQGVSWPTVRCEPGAVRVTFVCGYGAAAAVPPPLVKALKLLVRADYDGDALSRQAAQAILNNYRVTAPA